MVYDMARGDFPYPERDNRRGQEVCGISVLVQQVVGSNPFATLNPSIVDNLGTW